MRKFLKINGNSPQWGARRALTLASRGDTLPTAGGGPWMHLRPRCPPSLGDSACQSIDC